MNRTVRVPSVVIGLFAGCFTTVCHAQGRDPCAQLRADITQDLQGASTCQHDAECQAFWIDPPFAFSGCASALNARADLAAIRTRLAEYAKPPCDVGPVPRCPAALPAVVKCVGGRCQFGRQIYTSQDACEAVGGLWGRHGLLPKESCVLPAADQGQRCRNSSECEGACIAQLTADERELLMREPGRHPLEKIGACSQWQSVSGCHPVVDQGTVSALTCVD